MAIQRANKFLKEKQVKYNEYLKILIDQNSLSRENLRAVAQKAVKVDMDEFSIVVKSVLDSAGIDDSKLSSALNEELVKCKTLIEYYIGGNPTTLEVSTTCHKEFSSAIAILKNAGIPLDEVEKLRFEECCTIEIINGLSAFPKLHSITSYSDRIVSFEMPIGQAIGQLNFRNNKIKQLPKNFVEKLNACEIIRAMGGHGMLWIDLQGNPLQDDDVWEDKVRWTQLIDSFRTGSDRFGTRMANETRVLLRTNNTHPKNKTKVQFDRKNVPEYMVDNEYLQIFHKRSKYSDRYVPEKFQKSTRQSGGCF